MKIAALTLIVITATAMAPVSKDTLAFGSGRDGNPEIYLVALGTTAAHVF